jgi:hypothetical protein
VRALVAALALLTAASGAAQPAPTDPPAIPADALVPNDQARAFFEVLPASPMTDEMLVAAMRRVPGGAGTRPMDDIIERLLAPGEQVPDWQGLGIDLLPVVAARNGGLGGNIAEGSSQFGPVRVYLVDGPLESFLRPEWVLVGRRGSSFSGENVQIQVAQVSPKVIIAERIAYRRRGNAYCRERAESRVYADPGIAASEADMIAVMMTMRSLAMFERHGMCEVVEEVGAGEYRTRLFDVNGRRLPGLESSATFRIVPRPPVLSR